jgi:hypothetical protein
MKFRQSDDSTQRNKLNAGHTRETRRLASELDQIFSKAKKQADRTTSKRLPKAIEDEKDVEALVPKLSLSLLLLTGDTSSKVSKQTKPIRSTSNTIQSKLFQYGESSGRSQPMEEVTLEKSRIPKASSFKPQVSSGSRAITIKKEPGLRITPSKTKNISAGLNISEKSSPHKSNVKDQGRILIDAHTLDTSALANEKEEPILLKPFVSNRSNSPSRDLLQRQKVLSPIPRRSELPSLKVLLVGQKVDDGSNQSAVLAEPESLSPVSVIDDDQSHRANTQKEGSKIKKVMTKLDRPRSASSVESSMLELEPFIMSTSSESSATRDENPYHNLKDVEDIFKKYAIALNQKARELGKDYPLPFRIPAEKVDDLVQEEEHSPVDNESQERSSSQPSVVNLLDETVSSRKSASASTNRSSLSQGTSSYTTGSSSNYTSSTSNENQQTGSPDSLLQVSSRETRAVDTIDVRETESLFSGNL